MKKIGILNQPLSTAVAGLGHLDTLVIADAGLPIPAGPQRIDLALAPGVPSFLKTLDVVLTEMQVEKALVAEEMLRVSPDLYAAIQKRLGQIPIEMVTHLIFKEQTRAAAAIVRTGEFTPYANIILVAGVVF
ncbi:MAG: D-ribose pyranase [Anaerolineae bacterium]|nr:D-ribose pyranase [Anaerolineae bacterium]